MDRMHVSGGHPVCSLCGSTDTIDCGDIGEGEHHFECNACRRAFSWRPHAMVICDVNRFPHRVGPECRNPEPDVRPISGGWWRRHPDYPKLVAAFKGSTRSPEHLAFLAVTALHDEPSTGERCYVCGTALRNVPADHWCPSCETVRLYGTAVSGEVES